MTGGPERFSIALADAINASPTPVDVKIAALALCRCAEVLERELLRCDAHMEDVHGFTEDHPARARIARALA